MKKTGLAHPGRTVLILKDREKGNDVTNFRPITCLPFMGKIFNAEATLQRCSQEKLF